MIRHWREAVIAAVLIGALLGGVFWLGRLTEQANTRTTLREAKERADSVLRVTQAAFIRDSLEKRVVIDGLKATAQHQADEAQRLRSSAAHHAQLDRANDSLLATLKTAEDSLPVVIVQRDEARQAYDTLARAADSLSSAVGSLRHTVQLQDSLHTETLRAGAASEAALRALNIELAQKVHVLQSGRKLFGFLPRPHCGVGPGVNIAGRLEPVLACVLNP